MNNFIPVLKAHVKKFILLQSSCCHIAILDPTIHLLGLLINGSTTQYYLMLDTHYSRNQISLCLAVGDLGMRLHMRCLILFSIVYYIFKNFESCFFCCVMLNNKKIKKKVLQR